MTKTFDGVGSVRAVGEGYWISPYGTRSERFCEVHNDLVLLGHVAVATHFERLSGRA